MHAADHSAKKKVYCDLTEGFFRYRFGGVTGQGFQDTKRCPFLCRAFLTFFEKLLRIKEGQDEGSSWKRFSVQCCTVKVFKILNDRQSGIFNRLDLSKNPNESKLSFVD